MPLPGFWAPLLFAGVSNVTGALIPQGTGTVITNYDTRTTAAADGTTSQAASAATRHGVNAQNRYWGKDYGVGVTKYISKATTHGSNNLGYHDGGAVSITIQLRADNSAPSAGTEGTLLGSISFTQSATDESAGRDITSTNTATAFRYVWVYISTAAAGNNMSLAECFFYE